MTVTQQRNAEFYALYNTVDLFPFMRIRSFWSKIALPVIENIACSITSTLSYFRGVFIGVTSDVQKYVQGFYPV